MASITKTLGTVESVGYWTNCTTASLNTSDNSRATMIWVYSPNNFRVSDFAFGIPADSTIDGIVVTVERRTDNAAYAIRVDARLSWNDGTSWTDYKLGSNYSSTTDANQTLGGSTDTWGRTWAVSELADGTFALEVRGNSIGIFGQPEVDYLTVTIYYTEGGANPNISDTVTVTESATVLISTLYPTSSDTVTVTDTPTLSGGNHIDTSDSVGIQESVTAGSPQLISVYDEITVVDIAGRFPDDIKVWEVVTVTALGGGITINVSDSVSVQESASVLSPTLRINVNDSVSIEDSPTVMLGRIFLTVYDSVTVTESVSATIPKTLSVYDEISVTDGGINLTYEVWHWSDTAIPDDTWSATTVPTSIWTDTTSQNSSWTATPAPSGIWTDVTSPDSTWN